MTDHLRGTDIDDLRGRRLTAARARLLGEHVRGCSECSARLLGSSEMSESVDAVWRSAASSSSEPEARTYTGDGRSKVRPLVWGGVALAAAASIVALVGPGLFRPSRTDIARPMAVAPIHAVLHDGPYQLRDGVASYGRPEWDAVVAEALRSGNIIEGRRPAILESGDALRGSSADREAVTLEPTGVVLETRRPVFRWSADPRATCEVLVQRIDGDEVAASGRLHAREWRPTNDLPRGETYVWQLTVFDGGRAHVYPPPSDPQARFAIVDERTAAELAAARAMGSHLLPALLYARAGMVDEARAEASRFAAENPHSAEAARLSNQLRTPRVQGRPSTTNAAQ